MKIVINVPDYVKEQADDGKGEELGIPLWLAYEIANGTPLDNIRAEIAEEHNDCMETEHYDEAYGLELALAIIDKYKAESEDTE